MLYYGGLLFKPPYNLHNYCIMMKDMDKSEAKYHINY
jgi:hypothetical protein